MNKRIFELAVEAELRATLLFNEEKLEKFVELIVLECIEVSQVGSITEDKLKKHFGIEE